MNAPAIMPLHDKTKAARETRRAIGLFFLHVICVLLFITISLSSYTLFNGIVLRIPFFLILVFMAGLLNDRLCPAWLAFLAGMVIDFVYEGPLGLHAIFFIFVQNIVHKRSGLLLASPFLKLWFYFVIITFAVMALPWIAVSLLNSNFFNPAALIAGTVILGVLFPVFFKPLYTLANKLKPNADELLL
jgi:rod shape-determining protein MreD